MKGSAWASFALAIVAGAGLAATGAGLVQLLVVVAALAVLAVDIAKDRTPNQGAVIVAIALPSLVVGMNGKLAAFIDRWLDKLWNNVSDTAGSWAGTNSMLFVAIACVAISFIFARRTMPRSGGGR